MTGVAGAFTGRPFTNTAQSYAPAVLSVCVLTQSDATTAPLATPEATSPAAHTLVIVAPASNSDGVVGVMVTLNGTPAVTLLGAVTLYNPSSCCVQSVPGRTVTAGRVRGARGADARDTFTAYSPAAGKVSANAYTPPPMYSALLLPSATSLYARQPSPLSSASVRLLPYASRACTVTSAGTPAYNVSGSTTILLFAALAPGRTVRG